MYINKNKRNLFEFKFGRRFFGTSLALFLVSLTQEFLNKADLFVIFSIFLGMISVGAIYAGTKYSGFQKFLLSIGFVILVGLFASLLLWVSCYLSDLKLCEPNYFNITVAVYFALPLFSIILYLLFVFLGSFFRNKYHA